MSLPRTWLFCKDTNINQKNSIWHLVCTDLRRAMRGLMQRVLCAVSFSKHVSQHSSGSSHKLYKCCILKRSEKIKVKAILYAGRRYCDWSGRHVKPQGLFGHVHVKARRKPVEMKSRDWGGGGSLKQMVWAMEVRPFPSSGVALRGCAASCKFPLNVPTLEQLGSTRLREPFPGPSPRSVWTVSQSVGQGWDFCPFVQPPPDFKPFYVSLVTWWLFTFDDRMI